MLVEGHVVVADEVVALLSCSFGCLAIAPFQPGQHRFTDVDTTVVHNVGLHHTVAVGSLNLGQRPSKQIVADVSEVERFVGIGG